jgi:hypothetical protein
MLAVRGALLIASLTRSSRPSGAGRLAMIRSVSSAAPDPDGVFEGSVFWVGKFI